MRRLLGRPNGARLDERMLNEIESILAHLRVAGLDCEVEFSNSRRRLRELEEEEELFAGRNERHEYS